MNAPLSSPKKTTPPAVLSVPPHEFRPPCCGTSQATRPLWTSIARRTRRGSSRSDAERSAHVALPCLPLGGRAGQDGAPLVGLHVVIASSRVERRGVPVGRAVDVRADARALRRRRLVRRDDRPPLRRQS